MMESSAEKKQVTAIATSFDGLECLSNGLKSEEASSFYQLKDESRTMVLTPPGKLDYWRRTYYKPLLVKDDGPAFVSWQQGNTPLMAQVTLKITRSPGAQFDQGGIMVRLDEQHWIKTGIEVVDNIPRLSCVVTNEFSDWSTQAWSSLSLTIRVSQTGDSSYVVEALAPSPSPHSSSNNTESTATTWQLVRICHLSGGSAEGARVGLGVFGCCPVQQNNCHIEFTDFSITHGIEFAHTAD
eukprot:TRINITY_DN6397_c0_g1_i1.p1 TRINITY_DN6397_c0_g1~~TRINITY_DN6397_c0_g1_i1.p1  ORF type:complete len:240 (+),score=49.77 TRINITY_DN6397_c0_g1_i1:12-731(+)